MALVYVFIPTLRVSQYIFEVGPARPLDKIGRAGMVGQIYCVVVQHNAAFLPDLPRFQNRLTISPLITIFIILIYFIDIDSRLGRLGRDR